MVSTRRFLALFLTVLAATLSTSRLAQAQPVKAHGQAEVDLLARFKEAEQDQKLAEVLLKTGQKVSVVCANCHGDAGNSTKTDVPNLAGQNPKYLIDQLRQFADGRRRFEFMEGMIKAMSADEKIGVVMFYATQKVIRKNPAAPELLAKGKAYYNQICWRCHGDNGHGNDTFARIAGQQIDYLKVSLRRYRAGSGPRVNPLMAANTKQMTDADIDAVAAYVMSME